MAPYFTQNKTQIPTGAYTVSPPIIFLTSDPGPHLPREPTQVSSLFFQSSRPTFATMGLCARKEHSSLDMLRGEASSLPSVRTRLQQRLPEIPF